MHSLEQNAVQPTNPLRRPGGFGKRRHLPTITIESDNGRRQYRIGAASAMITMFVLIMFAAGYFSATAYLFLREDLIALAHTRNARLVVQYEERIEKLRGDLERATSRHLVDRRLIEDRLQSLLKRQELLEARSDRIRDMATRARKEGVALAAPAEADNTPSTRTGSEIGDNAMFLHLRGSADSAFQAVPVRVAVSSLASDKHDNTGDRLEGFMRKIEDRQHTTIIELSELAKGIRETADSRLIAETRLLTRLGGDIPSGTESIGGPYHPPAGALPEETELETTNRSLELLSQIRKQFSRLPIRNPVPGHQVSSAFGSRLDPFLKRAAMHSGIDFSAPAGTPVLAAGGGTVIEAGWNGGYGKSILVDHGKGRSSRYAHLQRIDVEVGAKILAGDPIGQVGTTGRSTGPHLHFEIRIDGEPDDPARFLKAGRELQSIRN